METPPRSVSPARTVGSSSSSSSSSSSGDRSPGANLHQRHDELMARMKTYEAAACTSVLNPALPFIVRLDGSCFSTFTSGFRKPFDVRIHEAMVQTAGDLVQKFCPSTAFTFSDEISLIFPPAELDAALPFAGRVQKMSSVFSSFAAVRFNYHISRSEFSPTETRIAKKAQAFNVCFDGRAFNLPDAEEVFYNIYWRCMMDCRRNSISHLAHSLYTQAELQSAPAHEQIRLCAVKGVHWQEQPDWFRFGVLVKKEQFVKAATHHITGLPVEALRTRVSNRSFPLDEADKESHMEMLFSKHWSQPDSVDASVVG